MRFPLADRVAPVPGVGRTPRLTWVGHSTFLLQTGGVNLLTDPHFTQQAFPVSWAGPRRTTPPGIHLDQLPTIDFVVISHNHYDHLDSRTVRRLCERQPENPPTFFVPLRLGATVERFGATRVIELDWWQSARYAEWTVRAVPAQHFSARTPFDRFKTLWAGWVLEHAGERFFFAGDSGYSPDFREIGDRLGPMDLSLLPIGAYEPRWFMRSMHLNPEEAVRAHLDLRSRYSVGMHWGTFILTDEPMREPPRELARARRAAGVEPERFFVLRHGETRDLSFLAGDGQPG